MPPPYRDYDEYLQDAYEQQTDCCRRETYNYQYIKLTITENDGVLTAEFHRKKQ